MLLAAANDLAKLACQIGYRTSNCQLTCPPKMIQELVRDFHNKLTNFALAHKQGAAQQTIRHNKSLL